MGYCMEDRRKDDGQHAERNRKADDYDRVAAELARLRLTDSELRAAVRALLDGVNAMYPDKNPREWSCPHMAALDRLVPPSGDE